MCRIARNLFNPDLYGINIDDDVLVNLLKNMTVQLGGMLQEQLLNAFPDDSTQIQKIDEYVQRRKEYFKNDRRLMRGIYGMDW